VNLERQRVLQLGGQLEPRRARDRARRLARESLQVADLLGVDALGGAPRRDVFLERHLEHDRGADPGDLGQQRRRVGNMLEDVREDAELA
jgi:hypothetical protein